MLDESDRETATDDPRSGSKATKSETGAGRDPLTFANVGKVVLGAAVIVAEKMRDVFAEAKAELPTPAQTAGATPGVRVRKRRMKRSPRKKQPK